MWLGDFTGKIWIKVPETAKYNSAFFLIWDWAFITLSHGHSSGDYHKMMALHAAKHISMRRHFEYAVTTSPPEPQTSVFFLDSPSAFSALMISIKLSSLRLCLLQLQGNHLCFHRHWQEEKIKGQYKKIKLFKSNRTSAWVIYNKERIKPLINIL